MTKPKPPEKPAPPPLLCATAGCPYEARVRAQRRRAEWAKGKPNPVHIPHGPWLNLCHSCNDAKVHRENIEYCNLMGLDTPAKQKAWVKEHLKGGIKMAERILRDPGQDDEEVTA